MVAATVVHSEGSRVRVCYFVFFVLPPLHGNSTLILVL